VAKVTYLKADDSQLVLDVDEGTSVMQAAVANGISEIVAECGGTLACATCHVYVDDADTRARVDEMSDDESEMLDYTAADREEGSRLSCQLHVTAELDGMTVRIPADQY
jgi:2Fe-2S ferredoxin